MSREQCVIIIISGDSSNRNMSSIANVDSILLHYLPNVPIPGDYAPPVRGSFISDERFAEASRLHEEYWKLENLTDDDRKRLLDLAGENCEHYIAKMSVMAAKLFIGTLIVNGRCIVIGDFAFLSQSDIDW